MLAAARLVLKPLVRVLLRGGVPFKEFAELAKHAYVEVATADYGVRGRPTNVSRTAILTGLNRREVARIRAAPPPDMLEPSYMSAGSRLLSGWHLDADYLDNDGNPRRLPLEGERVSFQALAARYAPDLPHIALYKALAAARAVDVSEDGLLCALKRSYIPGAYDPQQIPLWGSILHDMGATLAHNMTRAAGVPARFERRAIHQRVRREALHEFRALLVVEGQAFLEKIDAWLMRHAVHAEDDVAAAADLTIEDAAAHRCEPSLRLGVGVYMIQDEVSGSSRT